MKKLLIKIVSLITAAAVTSGGVVFGDDLGETGEEILVVNGNLTEYVANDGFENENVRLESDDNSDFEWNPEGDWTWEDWESMNWDGVTFTYEYENYEYQYGILNDGTVILLEYQDKYIDDRWDDEFDEPYEIDIPAQIDGKDVTVIGEDCFSYNPITEVRIPSTVELIGPRAFEGCESLNSIEIPYSVTFIGSNAFENCKLLSSFEIPDSVTLIGAEAFRNCESLSSIVIPESVSFVFDYAFSGCTSLVSVEINGTASISNGEFAGCTSLTSIEIPDGVITIGDGAFADCSSLSEVVIPDSVISIGWRAFSGCDLKNIYYTGNENLWNIIKIDYYEGYDEDFANLSFNYSDPDAFDYDFLDDGTICLTYYRGTGSVNIPKTINGKTVTVIGSGFLHDDYTITDVQIPDSVISIEDNAFYNCVNLFEVTISDSVALIGENAFEDCISLENVYYTGTEEKWESIKISDGNEYLTEAVCYAGDYRCEFLEDGSICLSEYMGNSSAVTIPSRIYGRDVTMLGEYIFHDCDFITSIEIPDSVISIGEGAFCGCISLNSIGISNSVVSIGDSAFSRCSSLSYIDVDTENESYKSTDGVLYSKDGSKLLCYPAGKSEILFTVPDDVTSIGEEAFCGCISLTSIEISNSVVSIGDSAFSSCSSLSYIDVDTENESYKSTDGVLYSKDGSKLLCYPAGKSEILFTVPDGVTSIGSGAFNDCTSLTSIIIPESVTSIYPDAFYNCSPNLIIYGKEGSYAETYAKNNNIVFKPIEEFPPVIPVDPDPVDPDPDDPDPDDDPVSVTIGDYTVYFTEDNGALTITDITGSALNLPIPAEINGKPVKVISETAFANAAALQSIYIPDSVDSIEGNPFAACPDLTDIYYGGTENKWYIAASGIPFEDDPLPDVTFHFGITGLSKDHPVKEAEEAGKETVETAIKFNTGEGAPVIYIEGNQAAITEEGLAVIKALNTPVILQMEKYSLKINPDDIRIPSDFSILVKKADSSDNIEQWAEPANSLMIIPQEPAEGDFGMTVEINLSEENLPFSANPAPYLYHIDGNGNIEDYSSAVSCDKDGKAVSVSLSHASKYLLTAAAVDLGEGPSSGSESPEPTVPTDPTNPSESPEPTVPTDPTNPSEPPEPTVPTDPTNPSEPPEPTVPTDPTNPSEPPEPTVPTDPTNPSEPPEPTVPTDPTNPSEPPEPTVPTDPTNPSESPEPTVPTDPTNPSESPEPAVPTDPTNPSESPEPSVPTEPTNPSESSVHTTELPSGMFVVPDTTTRIVTASTALENTAAANSGGTVFSVEFETEETAEATVTADEAQPVTDGTSSEMSTTVPPDAAEVSFDTTDSSTGNSGDANAPIGDVGAGGGQGDKNVNTGDSSVSLTPLMIISAAVVFNSTALFGKKKKDK